MLVIGKTNGTQGPLDVCLLTVENTVMAFHNVAGTIGGTAGGSIFEIKLAHTAIACLQLTGWRDDKTA